MLFAFFARVALVGLLQTPRGVAPLGTGFALSLRSAQRLEPFLSACALLCGSRSKGFPLGAVARGLPPFRAPRLLARSRHYLSARAYRSTPSGALPPLTPARGAPARGRCFS